jgi:AmiR/NasT family two-component response regulator
MELLLRKEYITEINQTGALGYIMDPIDSSRDMAKHATTLLMKSYLQ